MCKGIFIEDVACGPYSAYYVRRQWRLAHNRHFIEHVVMKKDDEVMLQDQTKTVVLVRNRTDGQWLVSVGSQWASYDNIKGLGDSVTVREFWNSESMIFCITLFFKNRNYFTFWYVKFSSLKCELHNSLTLFLLLFLCLYLILLIMR